MVVSIANQHVNFKQWRTHAGSPVSTGKPEKPTPTGVFSIIEKDRLPPSNLYDDAPMYYMHRLTWSGVAMHEGSLPGLCRLAGCIRLPTEFVSKLWQRLQAGYPRGGVPQRIAPHDFEHPNLFEPKEKPPRPIIRTGLPICGLDAVRIAAAAGDLRPALPATDGSEGAPSRLASGRHQSSRPWPGRQSGYFRATPADPYAATAPAAGSADRGRPVRRRAGLGHHRHCQPAQRENRRTGEGRLPRSGTGAGGA